MLHRCVSAGALCRTRPLLAYNKSSGYRWSPIPKPPPPHYDRLYGVHAVLNTLRVAAAAAAARRPTPRAAQGASPVEKEETGDETHTAQRIENASQPTTSSLVAPAAATATVAPLHPHRAHLSCLYVRDFSAEEAGGDHHAAGRHESSAPSSGKRRKVIPPRYVAVRCITALAKSLDVPVRFVPRKELVQLCGERRNQNVVLKASSYVPHPIQRLEDVWAGTRVNIEKRPQTELLLLLEHVIDPTNIGIILRTAFFFGVDHVLLSRDCAACTATVSRTSTGFLEHLHVHQLTVSTADFLRAARQTAGGSSQLEVIASAVTTSAVESTAASSNAHLADTFSYGEATTEEVKEGGGSGPSPTSDVSSCPQRARLLLLGNEDAGLPAELLQWCTHTAHVQSPRQHRLRMSRGSGARDSSSGASTTLHEMDEGVQTDIDGLDERDGDEAAEPRGTAALPAALTAVEKRELNLQRLARLREKEVSLNVNTATAALLTALVAVDGALPPRASLGMVEVQGRAP